MKSEIPKTDTVPPEPKPVKFTVSFWLSFMVVFLFVVRTGILPAIYSLSPSDIPPLEQVNKTTGKIDFDYASAAPKSGAYLIVADIYGKKETFSCRASYGSGHWCMPDKYRGREAEVWWFENTQFPGKSYNFPIQIVVGDEWKITRDEKLERVRSYQYSNWLLVVFDVMVLIVFVPLWALMQRSKNAIDNN